MFDLETWGTRPGSAIRSVGAAQFCRRTGEIGETFYANIGDCSLQGVTLKRDPSTVEWWSKQSKEAQDALLVDQKPFTEVAWKFNAWFKKVKGETVWAQGSNFDFPIWDEACKLLQQPVPWKYWATRDTRTVYDIYRFDPATIARKGTYHNALDDCRHQVECLHTAMCCGGVV
jgi:hypothetical protein